MYTHTQALSIWTVYHDPLDFPGKYVARRFLNDVPTKKIYVSDTLFGIRQKIPEGLICIGRTESDGPKVVEVWI